MSNGDWVLIDANDILIHIFRPEVREFIVWKNVEKKQDNISNDAIKNKMKYRISTVGKIKSNDEDIITRKYLRELKILN